MRIDPALIKAILEDTEAVRARDFPIQGYTHPNFDEFEIAAHVEQLIDNGYLKGEVLSDEQGRPFVVTVLALTIKGQDFLSKAQSPVIWEKALKKVASLGGGIAIDLLKQVLEKAAAGDLHL